MTKSDLRSGMIVKLKNGKCFVVLHINNCYALVSSDNWYELDSCYDEYLMLKNNWPLCDVDIMEVYKKNDGHISTLTELDNIERGATLVWKRIEFPEAVEPNMVRTCDYLYIEKDGYICRAASLIPPTAHKALALVGNLFDLSQRETLKQIPIDQRKDFYNKVMGEGNRE